MKGSGAAGEGTLEPKISSISGLPEGIVLETLQGQYCRASGVLKVTTDKNWSFKMLCSFPIPFFPPGRKGISWKVLAEQSQVAMSERILGAAESLLEGFPLAPEAQGEEMFPWKSAPQASWQPKLKGLESFAPSPTFMVSVKPHL